MVEFKNKIIQFGFGAVGKSFFEKVSKEIKFDKDKYIVISRNKYEHSYFVELGGVIENFIVADINRANYEKIFSKYLEEGDLLIDFADGVGTRDFVEWCAKRNVMYLNTGETDWDDNWYSIFEENLKKSKLRDELKRDTSINKCPIVLQHGNNPGLVSHFMKAGLDYIVKTQFKHDERLNALLIENKFNELARELDLREIHVNDNDYQEVKEDFDELKLYNTWSIDSFFFEMLSEATANVGTNEKIDYKEECNMIDLDNGFLEFKDIAVDKKARTYYPKGKFEGFMVPHEETITIAKYLEVKDGDNTIYRPTTMFLYSPCDFAVEYLKKSRVGTYDREAKSKDKPMDSNSDMDSKNSKSKETIINPDIVRGFRCPKKAEILYKEKIKSGTEYVGVLLLGSKFKPVWVGNRIKKNFLYRDKKSSFWQTPTITPVAMSALAACTWMIKNKDKRGVYFPEDIDEYKDIIKFAEKYISKTIYKTYSRKRIERELGISLNDLQLKDIICNEKDN